MLLPTMSYISIQLFLLLFTSVLLVAIYLVRQLQWHQKYRFPPSPPGRLPFVGHSRLMPTEFHGDKSKEWGMKPNYHL